MWNAAFIVKLKPFSNGEELFSHAIRGTNGEMCGILGVSGQVCSLKCLSVNACANRVCLFRHRLQREFLGVVEGGWFKKNCKAMFLFICLLVKCKKKKVLDKDFMYYPKH